MEKGRRRTSERYSAVDVVPPAAVDTGITDDYEETDAEEELGDADEVEGLAGRHCCQRELEKEGIEKVRSFDLLQRHNEILY